MNYHIITQDKFFDSYIEDIYKVNNGFNNTFWVRGKEGETSLLKTKRKVEYLGEDNSEYLIKKLQSLKPNDRLFVFWYDTYMGKAILDSGINNNIYVWVMGGDFYADPFWYHTSWLFDKYTLRFIKKSKKYGYPKVNWKRKPKNWGKIFDELKVKWNFQAEQLKLYETKLKTIHRINYLVMSEYWISEFDKVRELYPGSTFQRVSAALDQNFDVAARLDVPNRYDDTIKILIGNSADPTNNYIDAYKYLKNHFFDKYEIYSILSYGDNIYKEYVLKEGEKIFGNAFRPIVNFMERQAYIEFLKNIDVVIMYHNRQQACGNIITLITLGKPVFMKSISPVYSMLKSLGVTSIYDVCDIKKIDIHNVIESARKDRQTNIDKIANVYSEQVRIQYWKDLL